MEELIFEENNEEDIIAETEKKLEVEEEPKTEKELIIENSELPSLKFDNIEENTEEMIGQVSKQELCELREFLLAENNRILEEYKCLEEKQKQLGEAQAVFDEKQKDLEKQISVKEKSIEDKRKTLEYETMLFEKRMQILERGFQELDIDRQQLKREKIDLEKEREYAQKYRYEYDPYYYSKNADVLFAGVKNLLTLKKRYKDLIKIYHPDNICGDTELIQHINKEYEALKEVYRFHMEA